MIRNREVSLGVKRALAAGTIALCGAGSVAAFAQQAVPAQTDPAVAASAKKTAAETDTAKTDAAKTGDASKQILLAQQTTAPQPTAPAQDNVVVENVVVTGSMIARPNAETAESITILKFDQLKDMGIQNVEQALSQLTANTPALNVAQSTGTFSGGGSYANLRNLGSGRTLVLLDGQRLAPNAFSGNAVDLTGIPFSAIDSIQELKEGASSLYGSDAIAGVINFITKKNYQGAEVEVNFDRPQDPGGGSGQAEFTIGHGDLVNDGYNIMLTGSYQKQQELQATQRSFSAAGYYPALGVSSTNNPGTFPATVIDSNGNYFQYGYPGCAGNPFLTTDFGNCAYRYSAATDLIPEEEISSVMATLTKMLPGNNKVTLQYFYTQSNDTGFSGPMFYAFQMDPASPYYPKASQLTPTPGFATPGQPVDLTDPIDAVYTDPNNSRYAGNLNVEQRALLTFSGTNYGWDYSAALNYSKNHNDDRNVSGYPNEALLAPGGVLSDLINPFGPQSAAGQALINSSYTPGVYELGEDRRWSVDLNATHALGDAFNAGSPANLAIGASVQGEHFDSHTTPYNDIISAATGQSDFSVSGSRQIQAFFAEIDVPISKQIDLDLSDREDRYSDFGTTNNGKVQLRYQPAEFLTFRGTASTGFRAPTLDQLYAGNSTAASTTGAMGNGNPDCVNPTATGLWTAATCGTQGEGLFGGNRNLTPETSENFDLGAVISPVHDMGITIDYFRILLKNTIGGIPASTIYGDPDNFSKYIVPATAGPSSGTLTPSIDSGSQCVPYTAPTCGYIILTNQNTGSTTTDGIDLSFQYTQHTSIGTFHEDLEGTAVTQFQLQQYTGGPSLNLVGWFNQNPPAYRWSHNLTIDWTSPDKRWGGGVSNRFYSSYIDQFGTGPTNDGPQRIVGSYSIWDAHVSYSPIQNMTVLFGIDNILDTAPPFTNASQGNFAAGYNSLVVNALELSRSFYIDLKYKIF